MPPLSAHGPDSKGNRSKGSANEPLRIRERGNENGCGSRHSCRRCPPAKFVHGTTQEGRRRWNNEVTTGTQFWATVTRVDVA